MKANTYNRIVFENQLDLLAVSEMERYDFVVDNNAAQCEALNDHVNEDGMVVLNLYPLAVRDFKLGEEAVTFSTRFKGQSVHLVIPYFAFMGVYLFLDEAKAPVYLPLTFFVVVHTKTEATPAPVADNVVSLFPNSTKGKV